MSKLTPERTEEMCNLIRRGVPIKTAAPLVGISPATYAEWRRRGDMGEEQYEEFFTETSKALLECEAYLADKWRQIVTEGVEKRTRVYRDVMQDDGTYARVLDMEKIEVTGEGDWKGIAEFLARRFPHWRKPERVELTGADGGPIQAEMSPVPMDLLSVETKRMIVRDLVRHGVLEGEEALLLGGVDDVVEVEARDTTDVVPTVVSPFVLEDPVG